MNRGFGDGRSKGKKVRAPRNKPFNLETAVFLDIPQAAAAAGFSVRHFRRIVESELEVVSFGRKFLLVGDNFRRWLAGRPK